MARLREAAGRIRALLRGDGEGFDSELYPLASGVRLRYPVLRRDVPLLMGAWGPRGVALAGRIADEHKVGGAANPDLVAVMRARLDAGAREAGRSGDDVRLVFGAVTVVDEDGAAARALARREVAMYLDAIGALDPTVEIPGDLAARVRERVAAGDHAGAGALIPDDLLDRFAFSGTPDQVAAHAQALIDAGVDRVEFGTPQGLTDGAEGIRLIGERVIPQLVRP